LSSSRHKSSMAVAGILRRPPSLNATADAAKAAPRRLAYSSESRPTLIPQALARNCAARAEVVGRPARITPDAGIPGVGDHDSLIGQQFAQREHQLGRAERARSRRARVVEPASGSPRHSALTSADHLPASGA
jgi:hypothetical protein